MSKHLKHNEIISTKISLEPKMANQKMLMMSRICITAIPSRSRIKIKDKNIAKMRRLLMIKWDRMDHYCLGALMKMAATILVLKFI